MRLQTYKLALRSGIAAAALLACTPAFAQTPAAEEEQEAEAVEAQEEAVAEDPAVAEAAAAVDEPEQEITVTGTSIRGVAPVGSPVTGLTEEQLSNRGATTLAESIRQLPQVFNMGAADTQFGSANNANANVTAGTGLNLRGLGTEATLTVVDGRRLPLAGTGQTSYFDPSVIPSMAIGRIEVMADGGSAIYGADAVGGVVNLLFRRKFDGAEFSLRYGMGDDLHQYVANGIVGHAWNSGSFWLAAEYNKRTALKAADRDFFTDDFRSEGGPDLRPLNSNPGTVRVVAGGVTTFYAIPTGQNGVGLTAAQLVPGTSNPQSIWEGADALPSQDRKSLAGRIEQDVGDRVTVSFEGFVAERKADRALNHGGTWNQALTVPRTNAFFVHPTNPAAANVTVLYSFVDDYGAQVRSSDTDVRFGTADVKVDLGSNWSATAFGSYGTNHEFLRTSSINTAALTRALASNNPATAFNPFGDGSFTNPAVLASIAAYSNIISHFELHDAGVKADGPLFNLPAGAVRLAVGAEYQYNRLTSTRANTTAGNDNTVLQTVVSSLRRDVKSLFGELFVPVTAAGSSVGELTLSAAGRYDDYSDFGSTFNPKFGFTWKSGVGLKLRGSYGTSFRAPTLADLDEIGTGSFQVQNFRNSLTNAASTIPVLFVRGGNPNLGPEEARIFSIGGDYQPEWLSGLSLSATYFNVDYKNRIEAPGNDQSILLKPELAQFVQFNPPLALVQQIMSSPVASPTTTPLTSIQAIIEGRKLNSGRVKTEGLELSGNYRFDALGGNVNVGASAVHLFKFTRQLASTLPTVDILDTLGNPVSWQARGELGYDGRSGFGATAFLNYFGSYRNDQVTPQVTIPSYATVDLAFRYDLPEGNGLASGIRLSLDIRNAFDRKPNFVQNNNPNLAFDPQVADIVGRYFLFGIRKSF